MSLKSQLIKEVESIFKSNWDVVLTKSIPDSDDLKLNSNYAKELEEATVLYADLDGSTTMVDDFDWKFSAEIYKSFLRCTAEIIRSDSGIITAYDGDRIMAIYTGDSKNTNAVRSALKINYAAQKIINPALKKQYPNVNFNIKHVVGVDTTSLRVSRIGVHGDNDLVWIGRAANYAAKLTSLSSDTPTWITKAVYDKINKELKYSNGVAMWQANKWTNMDNLTIYCSNYHYIIS